MTGKTPEVHSDKRKQREERGERKKRRGKREKKREIERKKRKRYRGSIIIKLHQYVFNSQFSIP